MRQYLLEVGAFAEREKDLADVVLQVIVNSNMEKVREWKGSERIMCEALRVLMADELNEERMEGQRSLGLTRQNTELRSFLNRYLSRSQSLQPIQFER